jgi:hypothetical protein
VPGGPPVAAQGANGSAGHEDLVVSPFAERVLQNGQERASRPGVTIGGGGE